MMNKLLVMDIGGSKTRILTQNTTGNILSETVIPGVAAANDSVASLPVFEDALAGIENKEDIVCAAINLGGKNTEQIKLCFRKFFPDIPLRVFRESEGTAAYALGEEYNAPVVLMAGTGAIAAGKSDNGFVITGGWGCNIGDDGSGYDIGLQAIRMTLRELDNTQSLSPLATFLSDCPDAFSATDAPHIYAYKRDEVRERIYPLDRQNIASVTKTVAEFAEKGDTEALDIFRYSGEKLSELVICTAKKLTGEIPNIVITGGLIHTRKFWAPYFEERVHSILPDAEIHYVTDGLLKGTFKIAKELYEEAEKND